MFHPPRCPYRECAAHLNPAGTFYRLDGRYQPRCRAHVVQRYRCRLCRRGFSRQSFRADRGQKKPYLNAEFLRLMLACVGLRQAARVLRVSRRTVERRFVWLAQHATRFHAAHLAGASLPGPFMLDELETFEGNRYQPVTVPVLIEPRSLFLIASSVGPLRRKGRMTQAQRLRRYEHERLHGRRPSESSAAVRTVLKRLGQCVVSQGPVVLHSDRRSLYARLGRRQFGGRFAWAPHSPAVRRDRRNPLFPINHTNARLRHFLARLRRRSWCVSKRRLRLQQHLQIAALWVNYCRPITNRTRMTPAQALGLAERPYREEEVLAWRLDLHPVAA